MAPRAAPAEPRTLVSRLDRLPAARALREWAAGPRPALALGGVPHAAVGLLAVWLRQALQTTVCVVVEDPEMTWQEATAFAGEEEVAFFPALDTLPFDRVGPGEEATRQRLRTLVRLLAGSPGVVVTALPALLRPTLAPAWLAARQLRLVPGATLPLERVVAELAALGYRRESAVTLPGEFARRGGIVDAFPLDRARPWRAEWVGDVVDGLWSIDPESQASRAGLPSVAVTPARELPLDPAALARAVGRLEAIPATGLRADVAGRWAEDVDRLRAGAVQEGVDGFAPVLLDPAVTLLEHLPAGSIVVTDRRDRLEVSARRWEEEVAAVHEGEAARGELPAALPIGLADLDTLLARCAGPGSVDCRRAPAEGVGAPLREFGAVGHPGFGADFAAFADQVRGQRAGGGTVVILSRQEGRAVELAQEHHLDPIEVPVLDAASTPLPPGALLVGPGELRAGFAVPAAGLVVHADRDLFGAQKRRPSVLARAVRRAESSGGGRLRAAGPGTGALRALHLELRVGELVVHRDHGIARFLGMQHMGDGDGEHEYLQLEYADGHRLYVPAVHLDRIDRYVGGGDGRPHLSRLGTGEWERTRARVRRRVDAIAEDLVELYARRQQVRGHAYPPDSRWQAELELSFPYEETRDQLLVLEDIKRDMESERPMDRLLCGDVGFGKTEIAIRAAFKAVEGGRQVAVLVPTTVLAQQHTLTFGDRLQAFPVRVEQLSRLRPDAEIAQALAGLAAGTVDIVIGTHRLLQPDVRFHNLGLVILDEEQRFGVRQKERFKQLRAAVDVLSLSATPIPRTLHMALAGIRDLSVIRTPPEDRLAIRTYVTARDDDLVRDVVRRELSRRGQVYYLHNRVQTIHREAAHLRELVPEARVGVAHGQMADHELAQVMVDFMAGGIDVLCCTTIIESGLDIPNVNTLVIDDATRLGLAQLYQLRGRVGRAGQRAYAYLLYDPARSLSERADKRLDVIGDLQDLGSGFTLAVRDLEIRGAGNLLGEAQHGDISAVGLDLYNHLLRLAVAERQGQAIEESPAQVSVRLPWAALLPPTYISDERLRLSAYQELAAAPSEAVLDAAARTLRQRFGPPPEPARNLIGTLRVRLLAAAAGATAIETDASDIVIQFPLGHGVPLARVTGQFGRLTSSSGTRLRLARAAAGPAWPDRLLEVLREAVRTARVAGGEPVTAGAGRARA